VLAAPAGALLARKVTLAGRQHISPILPDLQGLPHGTTS